MQRAPTAPRVRQAPSKHEAVSTQSVPNRHDAPGVPFAVQTVRQSAVGSHSELLPQVVPSAFFARHTRVESQYAVAAHTKFGHA